jgi:hypothetical protein
MLVFNEAWLNCILVISLRCKRSSFDFRKNEQKAGSQETVL